MSVIVLVCLFSHFSLMAAENEHAGYVSEERRVTLLNTYGQHRHFFAKREEKGKAIALEIKFIRQDGEVCGACWDMAKVEQGITGWRLVSEGILKLIANRSAYVNAWAIKHLGLAKMEDALLKDDPPVRTIRGTKLLDREDMAKIMRAHMVKPWVVAFTEEALSGGALGTMSITAPGAVCCLLRESTVSPLAGAPVQGQNVDLRVLQEMIQTLSLSEKTQSSLMDEEHEHAGYVPEDRRQTMIYNYGGLCHFLADYEKEEMVLEIRFIRQDGTVCGACWDVFRLEPQQQCIWDVIGHSIQDLISNRAVSVNEWYIRRNMFEIIAKSLLLGECSVHPIYDVLPLEREDMAEIMGAHMVKPWVLALTEGALSGGAPGTVSITAPGAECCLMREPKISPLAGAPAQGQNVDLIVLQEMIQMLSEKTQSYLEKLDFTVQSLERRMTALESMHKKRKLVRRMTALKSMRKKRKLGRRMTALKSMRKKRKAE